MSRFSRFGAPPILLGAALAVLALRLPQLRGTWTDDAFITFRYARNFAEGRGMVFNEGERVEGLTNLAWAIALAPFSDGDILLAAQLIGLLCTVCTLALLARWAKTEGLGPVGTALALGPMVLLPSVPYWTVQGLETPAVMLLVTLGWTRYRVEAKDGGLFLSGPAMGLAPAFRPDAALLPILVGLHHLLQREHPRFTRRAAGSAVAVVFGAALLVGLKLAWFGAVLPNTLHAKVRAENVRWGVQYALSWAQTPAPAFSLLATVAVLWALTRARARLPAMIWLAWVAMAIGVNGDLMSNYRLLVPAWPAMCAALACAGEAVAAQGRVPGILAALVGLGTALPGLWVTDVRNPRDPDHFPRTSAVVARVQAPLLQPWRHPSWGRGLRPYWPEAHAWMLVTAPDSAVISFTELGLFSWTNRQRVLDPLGLTEPTFARRDGASDAELWRFFADSVDYVAAETTMGWCQHKVDYLADEGWRLVGGCDSLWILANPRLPYPDPQPADTLQRRVDALLVQSPRMPILHIAVAREMIFAQADPAARDRLIERLSASLGPAFAQDLQALRCDAGLSPGCQPDLRRCTEKNHRPDFLAMQDPAAWPRARGVTVTGAPTTSLGPGGDKPLGSPDGALAPPEGAKGPPLP